MLCRGAKTQMWGCQSGPAQPAGSASAKAHLLLGTGAAVTNLTMAGKTYKTNPTKTCSGQKYPKVYFKSNQNSSKFSKIKLPQNSPGVKLEAGHKAIARWLRGPEKAGEVRCRVRGAVTGAFAIQVKDIMS